MNELHLPWLELSLLIPLAGAVAVGRARTPETARKWSLGMAALTLLCTVGAWQDFYWLGTSLASDPGELLAPLLGRKLLVMDELVAPLLPLAALLYLLTIVVTSPTKIRRFSFAWTLVSEALLLAAFSCREPWGIIGLLAAGTVPPFLELRARGRPTRVYVAHMALFVGLLVLGWALVETERGQPAYSWLAIGALLAAVFVRSGIVPVHCWMTDLFEHATFGTALLFVTPMAGAYAAVRLVLPIAPAWALNSIGVISLITAVYAAGMALVQREARRFFCYIFLSHSALVLVGLETVTPIGLTGGLCVWLSVGLSLAGFGLTLRSIEARTGRLSLADYHGLYEHTPLLAVCFFLTGLASVGFPGTFGFVGTEILVDGVVHVYPLVGVAVVLAAALNGIAVVKAYFLVFTGRRHAGSISLRGRVSEVLAVLTLTVLILGGGVLPQPGVATRHHAAIAILQERQSSGSPAAPTREAGGHR